MESEGLPARSHARPFAPIIRGRMTPATTSAPPSAAPGLVSRELGLLGLAATGICSMVGASIHVVPIMIQRNVPGIGPYVLPAFLFAALPALLAAFAYAVLASAMPRAGGSYVYASRALHPYLGFAASFSQWFGLSIAIGVICYLIVPFLRDVAATAGAATLAARLDEGPVRLALALVILGVFVYVNLQGGAVYEWTLVPLMVLMFVLGGVVIVAGLAFDHEQFAAAALLRDGRSVPLAASPPFRWSTFFAGSSVLFASFIGFDAIAQAGGEARNPRRNLPLAILIAMVTVTTFYMAFAGAVYHAVPWSYVAREAATRDLTAPGLLGYLLSPGWTVAIVLGATISLLNDLPGMILSVSRLCFAWAEDGIFPAALARVHAVWRTPHNAILASGLLAAGGVLGSHFAGDFFLGIDLLVISMLVNFLLDVPLRVGPAAPQPGSSGPGGGRLASPAAGPARHPGRAVPFRPSPGPRHEGPGCARPALLPALHSRVDPGHDRRHRPLRARDGAPPHAGGRPACALRASAPTVRTS